MRQGDRITYDLKVVLDKDAPVGYVSEYLWLITNDPQTKHIPVPVEGQVQADISVSPSSLFLGVVQPGQSVTKQIVVRGQKPFRIASIRGDCECLQATAPKEPGAQVALSCPDHVYRRDKTGKSRTDHPHRDGFRSDRSEGARIRCGGRTVADSPINNRDCFCPALGRAVCAFVVPFGEEGRP